MIILSTLGKMDDLDTHDAINIPKDLSDFIETALIGPATFRKSENPAFPLLG